MEFQKYVQMEKYQQSIQKDHLKFGILRKMEDMIFQELLIIFVYIQITNLLEKQDINIM